MTYDLAVWEGEQPPDDKAGAATFAELYNTYLGEDSVDVEALLERWIDMTEDEEDISPWSAGPLIAQLDQLRPAAAER